MTTLTTPYTGKKQELHEQCLRWGVFNSAQVDAWGVEHYYTSACRRVRDMAGDENSQIRRILNHDAKTRGLIRKGYANLAWYEVKNNKPEQMVLWSGL